MVLMAALLVFETRPPLEVVFEFKVAPIEPPAVAPVVEELALFVILALGLALPAPVDAALFEPAAAGIAPLACGLPVAAL